MKVSRLSLINGFCFILLLLRFFMACQNGDRIFTPPSTQIHVDEARLNDLTDISPMLDSVRWIPLEETAESRIGDVSMLYEIQGNLLVYDRGITRALYFFRPDGKFLKKIHSGMKKPVDLPEISSVFVNQEEVFILPKFRRELLRFSPAGDYRGKIRLPDFPAVSAACSESFVYLHNFYNPSKLGYYRLLTIESGGLGPHRKYLPFQVHDDGMDLPLNPDLFVRGAGSHVLYHEIGSDTLFSLQQGVSSPAYTIHFRRRPIEAGLMASRTDVPRIRRIMDGAYSMMADHLAESAEHLMFTYLQGNQYRFVVFDRRHQRLPIHTAFLYYRDTTCRFPFSWYPYGNNRFMTFYYAEQLPQKDSNKLAADDIRRHPALSDASRANPVLLVFRLNTSKSPQ